LNPSSFLPYFYLISCLFLNSADFFVLWDEKILDHLLHAKDKLTLKSRKLLHKLVLPRGVVHTVNKQSKLSEHSDRKWLSKAQDLMLDFSAQCDGSHIVGVLYSLCFKASEGSNGQIDIYNKDAIAYGR